MFRKWQEAYLQRNNYHQPPWIKMSFILILCIFVYILIAIAVGPSEEKDFHFGSERGAITSLSAIFLACSSVFAFGSYRLTKNQGHPDTRLWACTSFALLFLAFDEKLMFHEGLGYMLRASVGLPEHFRNWNDVLVILYGIIALILLCIFSLKILKYPKLFELVIFSFIFFSIHTYIDSTVAQRTVKSTILEESAKLYCVGFLALSMLIGYLSIKGTALKKEKS